MRKNKRSIHSLREISFVRDYTKYAEGSVLVSFGDTVVLCNASIENSVPNWLKNNDMGWITAEYSMLPRATDSRNRRDVSVGRISGRSMEIQRLIGRSLRCSVDLLKINNFTVTVDCDVLQADGGTRTAAICGGFLALDDACKKTFKEDSEYLLSNVAAISLGIFSNQIYLDLDYDEDSTCDADINVVMTSNGGIVEIQGTAEKQPFPETLLIDVLKNAKNGINEIFEMQKKMQRDRNLKQISSKSL
ncbi:MAG: ribonuclease PH [Betaproteobacteria bacterium TMED156]|nr:MAG: ribonuclease PH [Betaproteobacteria bacterium TMED156]